VTQKDVFPLPRIDDLLDQLGGKCVFSTLDARSGYWQIPMHETSREKTAFVTMDGLYEFHVIGSMSSVLCPMACVMPLQLSRGSCRGL